MSDCGVCISNSDYFDGPADIFDQEYRTARKQWKCCECSKAISPSEKYEYTALLFDGRWSHYRTCLICAEISDAFCCDGRIFGELWCSFDEGDVWRALTTSCFSKLKTPEAKAELQRRWMEWKELI